MFEHGFTGPDFDGINWTNHGTVYTVPQMPAQRGDYQYTYGASRRSLRPIVPAGE